MRGRPERLCGAVLAAAGLLLLPASPAGAHQRQLLQIGGTDYLFVVGFLNEPVFTGDRSGVDLNVVLPDPSNPTDPRAPNAKPVEGLDETLKVEVRAGPRAKVLDLRPVWRAPGRYEALFYPTVATIYSYRFFGSVNGTPVDVTFTCSPAGGAPAGEPGPVKLADDVTRKALVGSFGCPVDRSEVEFPPARK